MSVIIILLGASLLVAIFFLAAFIWSVRNGQFEDNFSPAHRVLFETKPAETSTCKSGNACTNINCKSRICKN
ncbi:cbb3-type cytochrome oxidase assembly protein CcoS [Chitinophaga rhizophila]|uniref:Cbb3-type cytochrome oxidase assembly protein CcoS n=1 Tax=Chitinophaga rhizophila TaxID=2866212 RepID=A0ABS7GEE8_9BACT|nr:cbb3-type cytochrome oxidase assembly protein CcoS [Chitinophaga rhizophila]MBW8686043.1 cbb3-type cytochrome oxidase assembly protein CcoS [Chitinophaga rhizophila]